MKPSYNELIRLVELDDLDQAIGQLRNIATGARSKELALLSNRYSAWNKDRRMGMPTTNQEKNAIVAALLSIIDDQFREAELTKLAEPVKEIVNPREGDKLRKVFISHAFKNKEQVGIVIDLLEAIGIKSSQIFCSSYEGYGIDLGENFLERLKTELDKTSLVLFILTHDFYASPICLCEMGAAWINTSVHIPILIPPFDYKDVQGVFPLTQGMKINDPAKLNSLKAKLEQLFSLPAIDVSIWERRRSNLIKQLELSQASATTVTRMG